MSALDLSIFDEAELAKISVQAVNATDLGQLDEYAEEFHAQIFPDAMGFELGDYWDSFKIEMKLLICGPQDGEEDKYKDHKEQLSKKSGKSQSIILGSIAAAIGAHIGIEAGLLVPWVAFILAVAQKVGLETFCRTMNKS